MKIKIEIMDLIKSNPAHAASKMVTILEETGGHTRKPSYDGLHLIDSAGKVFALLKCVTPDSFALYLHSTTPAQTEEFSRVNGLAWEGRVSLDKKGYDPARLSGIKAEEVTPEFLAAVQLCVADGVSKRASARASKVVVVPVVS